MKLPTQIQQDVVDQAAAVVEGRATEYEAVKVLTDRALAKEGEFVRGRVEDCLRKALRELVAARTPADDAEQPGLFPELPRLLEVAPGRFIAQGDMRRRDWIAARTQARTKANNAAGHADKVDAAAEQALALLTDCEMTTAQVMSAAV